MAKIFRWRISRLYDEEERMNNEPRNLTVTVTPQNMEKNILDVVRPEGLANIPSDNLDWWDLNAENEIEGTINEDVLARTLAENNINPISKQIENEKPRDLLQERELKEDMVFLQIVEDQTVISDNLLDKYRTSNSITQDIKKLLWPGSKWLDFTSQARTMSANLYKRVLGE